MSDTSSISLNRSLLPLSYQITDIAPVNVDRTQEIAALLDLGVIKPLKILYKPFGGNNLFFYDEHLNPILDVLSLYAATEIIFTNQQRVANTNLSGAIIFNQDVTIKGKPTLRNWLCLEYPKGSYNFKDEYSFYCWSGNISAMVNATAYLQ